MQSGATGREAKARSSSRAPARLPPLALGATNHPPLPRRSTTATAGRRAPRSQQRMHEQLTVEIVKLCEEAGTTVLGEPLNGIPEVAVCGAARTTTRVRVFGDGANGKISRREWARPHGPSTELHYVTHLPTGGMTGQPRSEEDTYRMHSPMLSTLVFFEETGDGLLTGPAFPPLLRVDIAELLPP